MNMESSSTSYLSSGNEIPSSTFSDINTENVAVAVPVDSSQIIQPDTVVLTQLECTPVESLPPMVPELPTQTMTIPTGGDFSSNTDISIPFENAEPEVAESPSLGCCANCGVDFEIVEDQISTIYEEDDCQNIPIKQALKCVFETKGKENVVAKKSVFDSAVPENYLFCLKCSLSLSMLYRALRHFWQLCALDSLVSKQCQLLFKKEKKGKKGKEKTEQDMYEYPLHVKIEVQDNLEDFIDDTFQEFGNDDAQSEFEDSENSYNQDEIIKEERPQRKSAKKFYSSLSEIMDDNKSEASSDSFVSEDDDFDPNTDDEENDDFENNSEDEADSLEEDDDDDDRDFKPTPVRQPKKRRKRKTKKPKKSPVKEKKEEVGDYKCLQCPKSFITSKSLKRHERTHIPEVAAKLTCVQCTKTFSRAEHLVRHRVRVHGEVVPKKEFREKREAIVKSYTCPVCKTEFQMQYHEFKQHVGEHGVENPFTCPECPKAFSSLQQLKSHSKNHNPERPNYFCQVCNARFGRSYHLTRHQKNKHRVPNNISIDSQEIFDLLSSSDANADGSHICGICYKVFTRKDKLTTHVLKHTQEAPFSCVTCNKKFFSERGLENHKVVHSDNPFRCEICKKIFSRVDHLKKHIETHENKKVKPERSFTCETCGKEFKTNSNLKMHRYCHSSEKPFTCTICNKSFNHPSILSLHAKVHSDERPFCCSICGRTFKLNHHLRDHEAMHAENVPRPYTCEICGKAFKSVKHVRSHAKVHSDAKDHICSECGKAFSRIDNLRAHVRGVHLNDPAVKRRKKPAQHNTTQQVVSSGFHSQINPPPPPIHHDVQHGQPFTYLASFTHPHINMNY